MLKKIYIFSKGILKGFSLALPILSYGVLAFIILLLLNINVSLKMGEYSVISSKALTYGIAMLLLFGASVISRTVLNTHNLIIRIRRTGRF